MRSTSSHPGIPLASPRLPLVALVVDPADDESSYQVEAVFKSKTSEIIVSHLWDNAEELAEKVSARLVGQFPDIRISNPHWLIINDDEPKHPALDFWLNEPIIWDVSFLDTDQGAATTYLGERKGLYRGKAEHARAGGSSAGLKKWRHVPDPIITPPGPGPGPGTTPAKAGIDTWVLVIAAALTYWVVRDDKKAGARA